MREVSITLIEGQTPLTYGHRSSLARHMGAAAVCLSGSKHATHSKRSEVLLKNEELPLARSTAPVTPCVGKEALKYHVCVATKAAHFFPGFD